jgi:hypothetical protein
MIRRRFGAFKSKMGGDLSVCGRIFSFAPQFLEKIYNFSLSGCQAVCTKHLYSIYAGKMKMSSVHYFLLEAVWGEDKKYVCRNSA